MSAARGPGGLILALTATTPALALTLVAAPTPAYAEDRQGPDPTTEGISATTGPFAVSDAWLRGNFQFGDAQVFCPTSAADGPFGVVVICPGFGSRWAQMAWLGPRLASQGFVVVGIDTTTPVDQPSMRGDQLVAALRAAEQLPALQDVADVDRTALAG